MISEVSGLIPNEMRDASHEPLMFYAEDQTWDAETIQELREKYNVIYNGGIRAYRIVPRKDSQLPPFVIVGHEDDGIIQFSRDYGYYEDCFSSYWLNSIIRDLEEVKSFIEEKDFCEQKK